MNAALLVNVFREFHDRSLATRELSPILLPGGRLFIIDWKYEEMEIGPPLEHRISEEQVRNELEAHGFALQKAWPIYEMNYVLEFTR